MNPRYVTHDFWHWIVKLHRSVFGQHVYFPFTYSDIENMNLNWWLWCHFLGSWSGSIWGQFGDDLTWDPFCVLCSPWGTRIQVINCQVLACLLPFVISVLRVLLKGLPVEQMRGRGRNADRSSALTVCVVAEWCLSSHNELKRVHTSTCVWASHVFWEVKVKTSVKIFLCCEASKNAEGRMDAWIDTW